LGDAAGIRAGRAYVELGLNDSKFVQGLRGALHTLEGFGSTLQHFGQQVGEIGHKMGLLGAAITGPMLLAAHSFADSGHELEAMSKRTGISVGALQELGFAAKVSGASLEDVGVAIKKMQKLIGEALIDPAGAAALALQDLGFTAEGLQKMLPDEQLDAILKRLEQFPTAAERARAALSVFGRSGTNLLPMIENLSKTRAEARRLGLVMSDQDVAAAVELEGAWIRLKATVTSLWNAVGAALAPSLTAAAKRMVELAAAVRTFIQNNQALVVSVFRIGVVLAAVGTALTLLGPAITALGTSIIALSHIAGGAITVLSALGSVLLFLATPAGIITAAVLGLGVAMVSMSGATQNALSALAEGFRNLKGFVLDAFQGIQDAIAGDDLALAAEIAVNTLVTVWTAGLNVLKGWWIDFKTFTLIVWDTLTTELAVGLVNTMAFFHRVWVVGLNFWKDLFRDVADYFVTVWTRVTDWLAKKLVSIMATFDKSIDVAATVKTITEDSKREEVARNQASGAARIADQEKVRKLDEEHRQTVEGLNKDSDAEAQRLTDEGAAAKRANEEKLRALKDKQAALLAKAKAEKEAKRAALQVEGVDTHKAKVPAIPPVKNLLTDVIGTFNPAVLSRIGVGPNGSESLAERNAAAAEKTAKNTADIRRKMLGLQALVFEE